MKTNWGTGIDMTTYICLLNMIALVFCMVHPSLAQEYLLYVPQQLNSNQKVTPQDGILVQNIVVQKGDTLYAISRKFNGYGMYFPQILLFNSIKNPNKIYPGNTIKVPLKQNVVNISERDETTKISKVNKITDNAMTEIALPARKSAAVLPNLPPTTELSLSELKTVGPSRSNTNNHKNKSAAHARKHPSPRLPAAASNLSLSDQRKSASSEAAAIAGQQLFEAGVKAYRKGDCLTALGLLDRYLADNSNSSLAADASLYRAECYLKLSTQ
jgi:LysM repeat protein